MKKMRLFFFSLCLLNLSIQTNDNLDNLKWAYLIGSPLFYGHFAVNSIINLLKNKNNQKKEEKNNLPKFISTLSNKIKPIQDSKKIDFNKCALCSGIKNKTYSTLLTFGATINLIDRIIVRDPGSIIEITLKPILNAALMYGTGYAIEQIAKYQLLNN